MSVFKVNLKTLSQGTMDIWSSANPVGRTDNPNSSTDQGTGTNAGPGTSLQRQCYVMGPKHINRLMVDGESFTDCNYWKQFCPATSANPGGCDPVAAFLSITTDDGAPWSSVPSEQTFAWSTPAAVVGFATPTWTSVVNFATLFGSYATSAIVTNGGAGAASIRINGSAIFPLGIGATQVFSTGDLVITSIEVMNVLTSITVFAGVKQVSNS